MRKSNDYFSDIINITNYIISPYNNYIYAMYRCVDYHHLQSCRVILLRNNSVITFVFVMFLTKYAGNNEINVIYI